MNKWSLIMSLTFSAVGMSIVAFMFSQAAENAHYYFYTYSAKAIETLVLVSIVQTTGMFAEQQFQRKFLTLLGVERRKIIELLSRTREVKPTNERSSYDEPWD